MSYRMVLFPCLVVFFTWIAPFIFSSDFLNQVHCHKLSPNLRKQTKEVFFSQTISFLSFPSHRSHKSGILRNDTLTALYIIISQVKLALLSKNPTKAAEMEVNKLEVLLAQVLENQFPGQFISHYK